MKAVRSVTRKRPSPARAAAPSPRRNKLRAPVPAHNGPPDKAEIFAATASEWEARLCEMELRLTQSELENRKLREAYQRLEAHAASRARLHDAAAVGLVTLDTSGMILEINHTAAALLGWEKRILLQRRFTFLVAPEDKKKFVAYLRHCQRRKRAAVPPPTSLAATGRQKFQIPTPHGEARRADPIELTLRAAGGWAIRMQLACVPVRDERSRVVRLETTLIDITERKKMEKALRATEGNLRALIEASPHPIQFKDTKARWQLANRAALEMLGLTHVDYRNKSDAELARDVPFYQTTLAAHGHKDRAVLRKRRRTRSDEIVPTPDGPDRVFDVIRMPLWHADGRPKGLVVISYDITERKNAEEIIELESRFPRENPAPVIRLNQGRLLSYANPSALELLEEWGIALGGEAPAEIVQTACDSFTSGRKCAGEWTCGSRVYAVAFVPVPNGGYVNLYFSDITERKAAEEALRQSEDRFRTLAGHAPVGIFLSDAKGESIYVNETWCALAGLRPEEALGRNWLKAVHPEDRERVALGWDDAVGRRDKSNTEFRFQRRDGWVTWVQGQAIQLRDENGFFLGYIGTVADITQRKRSERHATANLAVARILANPPAFGEATPKILQTICETLGWDVGNLWTPDPEAKVLRCSKIWHAPGEKFDPFVSACQKTTFGPGVGLPGRVWEGLQPVWIPDAPADANFPRAASANAAGLHTGCGFPIMAGNKFLGMMEFFTKKLRERDEDALEMFGNIGSQIGQFLERQRAEEALRESNERMRIAQQATRWGVFDYDYATGRNYWSSELEALYGLSPGEFEGTYEGWRDRVHPDDRAQAEAAVSRAIETGEYSGDFRVLWRDGSVHWLFARAKVICDGENRPVRMLGVNVDITERKRAEEALRRFAAIVESSEDAIVGKNLDGIITSWNPGAEKLFGYTAEEIIGKSVSILIPPDHPDEEPGILARLRRGESIRHYETIRVRKNGRPVNVSLTVSPIKDATGKIIGASKIARDITEEKQAQEALRQVKDDLARINESLEKRVQERTAELVHANETLQLEIAERKRSELARLRLVGIVESSLDAILSKTLRGTITSWNKAAELMFGYTAEEIVGRNISILHPPNRMDELAQYMEVFLRDGAIETMETVRVHKDGRLIDVSLTLSPIRDEGGKIRAASAIMRDISQRKAAEKALRESEARLQAIMDNSPAMIFLKDREGRYLHFNRQFAQVFHLRLEESIGKTDAELFPPEQAKAFRHNDLALLQSGAPIVFDEVAMHDDGPHTSVVSKAPLYDETGRIYALVGIVTDITERKRLEEEVLHISEREHRRIAQDLHDGVGQQLAGISCLSNVLKKSLSDQGSPEAETATRISHLLDAAVAQTRSLARGLHPVEPEPSGLMSALEELAVMVTDLFKVSCKFHCAEPVLIEDNKVATHLYRIAQEAVTNSLKHGRAQKIKIGLSATPERIVLAVGDDGIGFKKSARKKTGLGLRIMKYRAGMIGGTFVMQKKTKGGTDVVCTVAKTSEQKDNDGKKTAKGKRAEKDFHRG